MTKILAIGNSFSQDGTMYLNNLAEDTKVLNIAIGGCSLYTHNENIENDNKAYLYELNGVYSEGLVSVRDALTEDDWDIVTFQQASHDSGLLETYFPYLSNLSEYAKKYAPNANQYMQKTWAYEKDSTHPGFIRYNYDQELMYEKISYSYKEAARIINAHIIPVGDVIQALRKTSVFNSENGIIPICRDGFHLSLTYGRYAAAATWYETLLNRNIFESTWVPEETDINVINLIRETVHSICKKK